MYRISEGERRKAGKLTRRYGWSRQRRGEAEKGGRVADEKNQRQHSHLCFLRGVESREQCTCEVDMKRHGMGFEWKVLRQGSHAALPYCARIRHDFFWLIFIWFFSRSDVHCVIVEISQLKITTRFVFVLYRQQSQQQSTRDFDSVCISFLPWVSLAISLVIFFVLAEEKDERLAKEKLFGSKQQDTTSD